jgi:hypothetical protein
MRIPPYYRYPAWQRFFAGAAIGIIIGYCFFIVLHGLAQERQIDKILEQETIIEGLKNDIKTLREGKDKENEELEKQLTVQEVNVKIDKGKFQLNHIVELDLKQAISSQLNILVNKNIDSVAENSELIFQAINGHNYQLEEKTYYFKVKTLVIFSTVQITVLLTDVKGP